MRQFALPLVLYVLTFASTFYAGARLIHPEIQTVAGLLDPHVLGSGWLYAVPLMAILTFHELGHYFTARHHRVDASPPYFLPLPFVLFGTLGAVIRMRGAIGSRNALLDVGASGPLAGMAVALPVLLYGIATSPVQPVPHGAVMIIEGHSLLYVGLLWLLKGPIPHGQDIMLNPVAFAGWTGLFVTMLNLLPVWQLDGGHVAYALLGERQNRWSRRFHRILPFIGLLVSAYYGLIAFERGTGEDALMAGLLAGIPWIVWALLLWLMTRLGGHDHPATEPGILSPARRRTAILTLALFVLLFMPAPLRIQ